MSTLALGLETGFTAALATIRHSQPGVSWQLVRHSIAAFSQSTLLCLRAYSRSSRSSSSSSSSDVFGPLPVLLQRRVVVTGIGMVTPLGVGVENSWSRLIQGHTGVRKLQPDDLPADHRQHMQQLPCQVIAAVPRAEAEAAAKAAGVDKRRNSPFISHALVAAAEAMHDANWHPSTLTEQAATGVSIGAGMSCTTEIADAGALITANSLRKVSPYFVPRILINMAAGAVSIEHQLQGPNHAVSTACATGIHCVGDAFRMVQRGDAEVMLAGATEACIDAISIGGFCRLKALSTSFNNQPEQASRPFDAARVSSVTKLGHSVLLSAWQSKLVWRGYIGHELVLAFMQHAFTCIQQLHSSPW
eukprot:GHRR01016244.1.p1 GENE.GHRR01016244.1~~GHRR01016244.1.p1  ORF type:complete len:360 (+),score=98.13 GHRR01016244.1:372-1451(+)